MNIFDIVILGNNSTARSVAQQLVNSGKKIAVVAAPESSLIDLETLIPKLSQHPFKREDSPTLPAGLEVFVGSPTFINKNTVQVNGELIRAKNFVIAMGAHAYLPPIQGLPEIHPRSLLEFFSAEKKPTSLILVGAGPIGVLMATRAAELNCDVTLLNQAPHVLPDEEPEISALISERLSNKKVHVLNGVKLLQVQKGETGFVAVFEQEGRRVEKKGAEIFFATGLAPNIESLGLERAEVFVNHDKAISINEQGQTSNPHIFAAGAITSRKINLSMAALQAKTVAHNLIAPFYSKLIMENDPLPTIIPTDPPLARVGLTEKQARLKYRNIRVSVSMGEEGLIKLIGLKKGGRLLGAHIGSPHSEGAIHFFNLVMRAEISLHDLADEQHYPPFTIGELLHQSIKTWIRS